MNAKLPSLLAERDISFLGPTGSEMQRVRDRAANLIIAQTLGIRTLPWSGSGIERDAPAWSSPRDVAASEAALMALGSPIVVGPALMRRACVASVEEALSRAERITYPVWLHLAVPTHGAHLPHPGSTASRLESSFTNQSIHPLQVRTAGALMDRPSWRSISKRRVTFPAHFWNVTAQRLATQPGVERPSLTLAASLCSSPSITREPRCSFKRRWQRVVML